MEKEKKLEDLKSDIDGAIDKKSKRYKTIEEKKIESIKKLIEKNIVEFHNYEFSQYIENYKTYIGDVSERLCKIDSWKTNVSHPLVFMMVDTVFGTIFDFDYQMNIKSDKLEDACIRAYDFKNQGKRVIGMAGKEAIITGKGIMRDYTYYEKGSYEAFDEEIEYEIKSPTMEYISVFNVMYDRMKGLNDSEYKIIRQFLSKEAIEKKIFSAIKDKDVKEKMTAYIDELKEKENNDAFSMYNYEAIKGLIFSDTFISNVLKEKQKNKKDTSQKYQTNINSIDSCNELNTNKCKSGLVDTIISSPFYNDFDYKYEVVEVIHGKEKHMFINGKHIITTKINPHIYNLTDLTYNEIPGSGKSVGIAFILKGLSDMSNAMLNMYIDSVKLGNVLMFRKKGISSKDATVKIKDGKILDGDIARINLGGNDTSGMNGVQVLQQIAQTTLGINQMLMGGDSRVQRISGAFEFAFSQYKARLTPFTDSIDMAMTKIIKGWICQYITIYSEEELEEEFGISIIKERKDGKENGKIIDIKIDDISMKDILNEKNISFKFDSMYNLKQDANKKLAMDIFQIAQQYNNSKVDGKAFVKLLAGDSDVSLEQVLGIEKEEQVLDDISDINEEELFGTIEGADKIDEKTQKNLLKQLGIDPNEEPIEDTEIYSESDENSSDDVDLTEFENDSSIEELLL